MADETKKARELQRKFDALLRELREQDEELAAAYQACGETIEPFGCSLPRVRFTDESHRATTREPRAPGALVLRA